MEFGEKMLCISNHMQMQMQMVSEQSDVNSGRSSNSNNNNNNNNNNPTFAWYSSSSWQPSVSNNNHSNNSSLGLFNNAFHTAAEATSPHRQAHPDPHLTCLKLGKRHYFEDSSSSSNVDGGVAPPLRGEKSGGTGVARCQVEGCEVALAKSKEYHRRHKVCEMHSKAPIVVVLGRDQRFCQQCSRFHVVSEFDESKRSCRRRLAGHNERRRKNAHHSQHQHQHQHQHSTSLSVATNNSTQGGCALSLLSAGGAGGSESWLSHHSDLSIRCSAALHELIAENRAALLITSRHHLHLHDTDHLNHPQWDQRHY